MDFFVGLAFAVVGIGVSIYFFWNRWYKSNLKPITDNVKTDELKIIKAECKKESVVSLNSDDLGAPVPANKQKERHSVPSLCCATDSHGYCRVAKKEGNNLKNNLEEYNMGNFWGPKTPEECQKEIEKHEQQMKEERKKHEREIEELKKKKLEFEKKEGVAPIKPVGQEKILPPNISNITMRSNNDNSNWMDPNDLNNTFEYPNVDKKALNAIGTKIKQNVKQEIKNQLAETKIQEQLNNHEEKINKNTEDIKEMKKDIKDIKDEQIDLKKMIARSDAMLAEMKQQTADIHKQTEEMDKRWAERDAKWMEMFGPYLKKKPRSSRNDNRESTNTSFSSFRGYMNMNNSQIPRMERADMAHSYDENQ